MAGNARFVIGRLDHTHVDPDHRAELKEGQSPFAVVVACADSRVTPELIFDQGIGDLFVVRVAGNICGPQVLGSIEYAVAYLGVHLVLVMGHQACGAVTAAVAGDPFNNAIDSLLRGISPAVEEARGLPGDLIDNTVRLNATLVATSIARSEPVIRPAVAEGSLEIVPAYYHLGKGKVDLLPPR